MKFPQKSFSWVWPFVTPWTVSHQFPLFMGFSRHKNTWVGCHFLLQGIFPTQGLNSHLLHLHQWATREAHREQLIIAKTWPFFENPGQLYPCQFLCQRLLLSIVYGSPLILGSQDILLSPLQLGKVTRLVLINGWWMEAGSTQGVGWSWAKIIFKTPAYISNSI